MKRLKSKLLAADYSRFLRRLLALALVWVLAVGAVAAFACRAQISEAAVYLQAQEDSETDVSDGTSLPEPHGDKTREHHKDGDWEDLPISRPSGGALLILAVWIGGCIVLLAAYWLCIACWLYRAADDAGLHGLLWLLIGLAGNLFAVLLFVLVRSIVCRQCPTCSAWQDCGNKFCEFCGAPMAPKCPSCGADCSRGKFCPSCGTALESQQR